MNVVDVVCITVHIDFSIVTHQLKLFLTELDTARLQAWRGSGHLMTIISKFTMGHGAYRNKMWVVQSN